MDECKYCAVDELGDPAEGHKNLTQKKVATIGSTPLQASVDIISGRLWWSLCGDTVDYPAPSVKTRFCPMCGRDLKKK